MEEEQPKKKRIGLGMGIFLLLAAIAFDVLGVIATALAPAIGGIIVNCIGVLVFLPWLYLLNVSLISPKQSLQWIVNMGVDFGSVGVWCGFTLGTILTLIVVYFEDKTHVPITAVMSGKNMGRKVLRRIQDPKKAIAAQQRLQRMQSGARARARIASTPAINDVKGWSGAKKEFVNLNALKRENPEKYLRWDEKSLAIAQNKLARRETNPERTLNAERRLSASLEAKRRAWQEREVEAPENASEKTPLKDFRPTPPPNPVENGTKRAA